MDAAAPRMYTGDSAAWDASAAALAELPCFDVESFRVDADSTCRYSTRVRMAGRGEWVFATRWSEMEALIKDLRALFTSMPENLVLPKYFFKTTDEAKLEARRLQLQEFWDETMNWLGQDDPASAVNLMETKPLARFLQSVEHEFHEEGVGGAAPPPPVAGGYEPEPEPQAAVGGRRPPRGRRAPSPADDTPFFNERRKMAPSDFEALRTLGKGSFGKVLLVRKKSGESGGQLFAMKILQKRKVVARNQVEHTRAERNVLERTPRSLVGINRVLSTCVRGQACVIFRSLWACTSHSRRRSSCFSCWISFPGASCSSTSRSTDASLKKPCAPALHHRFLSTCFFVNSPLLVCSHCQTIFMFIIS